MQRQRNIILLMLLFILTVKVGQAQPEIISEDLELRPKIEYKAQDLKDPFQSLLREKKEEKEIKEELPKEEVPLVPLPSLVIQGIVWGSKLPQVIINNKVLKIGDTIEGLRIIDINKDGVTLSFNNREYSLPSPAVVNLEGFKKPGGVEDEK